MDTRLARFMEIVCLLGRLNLEGPESSSWTL